MCMATYYHTQESGGDKCVDNRDMYLMLYPNTKSELDYSKSGSTITNTLDQMGQELLNATAINHYNIQRFHVEDYEYPNLNDSELDNISCNFLDYLKGPESSSCFGKENGTGDDLSGIIGVHLLLHSESCNTSNVSAGGGTDDCDTGSAFTQGRMAWTSVSCSDSDLTRNSVIQESLHQFILANNSDVQSLLGDCDGDGAKDYYEEHSLGKVYSNNSVSPMLTYHVNEHSNCGDCATTYTANGWDPTLTNCTKNAVKHIADDQCGTGQADFC